MTASQMTIKTGELNFDIEKVDDTLDMSIDETQAGGNPHYEHRFYGADIEDNVVEVEITIRNIASLIGHIDSADSVHDDVVALRGTQTMDSNVFEAELLDSINKLEHVVTILQEEMIKNPAFMQKKTDTRNMNSDRYCRSPQSCRADNQPTMTSLKITVQVSSRYSLTCSRRLRQESTT